MAAITAILIAAGESTRMGRPKPLLPWQGKTLLEYQIASLLDCDVQEIVVVLGHEASQVVPYVRGPGIKSVINPRYREGKATSIKAGLRSIARSAEAILLLAVDQPRPREILENLVQEHQRTGSLITAPQYQGHGGHPIIFSAALKPELERISEETQGVRQVMDNHKGEVNWVNFDTPIVRLDINDPQSYDEAKRLFGD
ncbi:MAG: nucleotidyltransferase family protein [Chloroflexi bacterium]|nr:nucleotidyltransferase family protein [Chloroflexota bacterium]